MEPTTVFIGLLLLCTVNGQTASDTTTQGPPSGVSNATINTTPPATTTTTPPTMTTTTPPTTHSDTQPTSQIPTTGFPTSTTAVTDGPTTDTSTTTQLTSTSTTTTSPATATNTTTDTTASTSTISPSTVYTLPGTLNTTDGPNATNTTTTSPSTVYTPPRTLNMTVGPNATNTPTTSPSTAIPASAPPRPGFATPNFGSCSRGSPTCCLGLNNTCISDGCYCDVACLRFNDCCSDFVSTCVNGSQNPYNQSTQNNNIPHFSGSCSAGSPRCCIGTDIFCFQGCFCDEACQSFGDCCPDYYSTCSGNHTVDHNTPDFHTVISNLVLDLEGPENLTEDEIESALEEAVLRLESYLKQNYDDIYSLRIKSIRPQSLHQP